ncbi:MAG: ABC transporter permease, partial [Chloroflexi bacterium]|nr:ABC transporter permease [Chloroflexota bacterium]
MPRISTPYLVLTGGTATSVYVLFIGLPLVALLLRAAGAEGFLGALTGESALTALRLSLFTSAISMAVVVLVGTPFAYLLARSRLPGIRILDTLVELPLVLPPVVAGLAMLMAFGRRGLLGQWLEPLGIVIPFTFVAVVFAQVFVAAPFYIRSARLGFEAVNVEYEELSQTLGVSPLRTFWRVTLPLAWP